jgi:Lrp/AsnC family transcriptional regulator, regulator for asnA, asnC and gidA
MSDLGPGKDDEFTIDDLDLRIIAQLHDDGRKPATEIARILDVPRTTVARRIERLVTEQVITVGVYANGERIGLPIHVMAMLVVEPNKYESVVSAISTFDELRWVGIATGPCDLLIEGLFRSEKHLRVFLLKRLAAIDGIVRMQTMRILEVSKITFDWEAMRRAGNDGNAMHRSTTPDDSPMPVAAPAAGDG